MFLSIAELKTRANPEIIDAITQNDDAIVEMIISETITLMKGYLNARFNADAIFNHSAPDPGPDPGPDPRDPVVVKILKDIVIYEVYSLHNPNIVSDVIEKNMERAMEWLRGVQAAKINPDLPKHPDPDEISYIISGSNPQRTLHY